MELGSAHGRISFIYDPAGVSRAKSDLESLGQAGNNVSQQMTKVGGAMLGVGGAISAGVGIATGMAASFEKQMDAVTASLDNTGLSSADLEERYNQLADTALRIGAETQFSANEAGAAMEELAKLGFEADEIMGGVADSTVDLAAAVGTTLPEAASAMGAVMNTFNPEILGMEQGITDSADAADTLTAAVNASAVDLNQFMAGFRPLGAQMALVGEGFEETAAAIAYFSNFGLKAADVGVSLARGINNLVDPTSEAAGIFDQFGIQIKAFAEDGSFLGLPAIMDQLGESMKGLTEEQKSLVLTSIFGAEAVDVMGIAALTSGEGLREMTEQVQANGQAAESARIRMDNFAGAMETLSGSVQTALIAFGTPLLGGMRNTAEGLTELVNSFINLDPAVQGLIARTIALTGTLLGIGGSALIAAGYFVKLAQAMGLSQTAALRFVGAFGAIGALAALAAGAYATNFLGFGDAVRKVAGNGTKSLSRFLDEFQQLQLLFRGTGLNKAAAAVKAFGAAFTDAFGIDIEGFTDRLSDGIQAFGDHMEDAALDGVAPMVAGLFALGDAAEAAGFPELATRIDEVAQAAANFGAEFAASSKEAATAGYDGLAAGIIAFGDALDYVTGIPVEGAFRRIAEVVQTMQNAFDRATSEGLNPFQAALEGIKSGLSNITGLNIDGLTDNLGNFAGTLRDVATEFVSGDLAAGFDRIGTAVRNLGNELGPQIQQGIQDIANAVTSIDLGQIAVNISGWIQGKWADLQSFIQTEVLGRIPAIDLGMIAGEIQGWLITAKEFIGDAIKKLVGGQDAQAGLGGTGTGDSVDLGTITASISNWLVEQRDNLATKIQETVERAKIALGAAGAVLGQIRATIESWDIQETAGSLVQMITTKATEIVGQAQAINLPQVAANVVSWAVNILGDLGAAIQSAIGGGGGELSGSGHLTGPGSFSVDIPSVTARIAEIVADIAGAIGTFLSELGTTISDAAKEVPIASIIAKINTLTLDAASALPQALTDLVTSIGNFIKGTVITISDPVKATVTKVTIEEDPASEATISDQIDTWAAGIKNDIFDSLNNAVNQDPGGVVLDFGDLGGLTATALEDSLAPVFDTIGGTIEEGGARMLEEIVNFERQIGPTIDNLVLGFAALPAALALFATDFVATALGFDVSMHEAGDKIKSGIDAVMEAFGVGGGGEGGLGMSELASGGNPFLEGAGGSGPFDFFSDILTSAQETINNFVTEIQSLGDTLSGQANPFLGVIEAVQGWIDDMQSNFQNLVFGFSPEGGGSFRGGTPGIAQQLADQVQQMFDGIGPAIEAALPDENPFQPAIDKMEEWVGQITSFDFFGLKAKDAGAAGLNAEALGEEMGTNLAGLFGTEEFASGLELAMLNVETTQFLGVAEALMTKISEGLTAALGAIGSTQGGVSESGGDAASASLTEGMAGSINSMVTGMIQPMIDAINALDIAIFAPIGTALMAKIQEGLQSAMQPDSMGGPGTRGEAGTISGGSLATSMIQPLIDQMTQAATTGMQELAQAFQQGGAQVAQAITTIGTAVGINFQNIVTTVNTSVTQLQTSVQAIATAFTSLAAPIGAAIQSIASAVSSGFASIQATVDAAVSGVQTSVQGIATAFQQLAPVIGAAVNSMTTTISSAFATMQSTVDAAVSGIQASVQAIVPALQASAAAAGAAAASIGQAIVAALDAAVPQVAAAAGRLGAAATVPIEGAIQPGSPSRVVMPWAESIPEALVTALNQGEQPVAQAAASLADQIIQMVQAKVQEIRSQVEGMMSGAIEGAATGVEEAAPVLEETAAPAIEEAGTGLSDAAATGIEGGDLCTPMQNQMTSAADCATETMEGTTPQISDSMGTAMETAANGATDSATAAGESLGNAVGTAAGDQVQKSGADAGSGFGTEMVSAMKSKMSDAATAGEGIGQTAIQSILGSVGGATGALENAGQTAGNALSNGINNALDSGISKGLEVAESKARELSEQIRANVEERIAQMRQVQETWMSRGRDMVDHRNENMQRTQQRENQPINIHAVLELDGDILDERIIETAVGPMVGAFDRVGSRLRGGM